MILFFVIDRCVAVLGQMERPSPLPQWVSELLSAILALVMIAVLVWWLRPTKGGGASSDFVITVEGSEVLFRGKFPERLEGSVEDFLLRDCAIEGRYEVRGLWEEGRLIVTTHGENAAPYEQRIRNFLKLHYRTPSA